jgi:hypothetical protein
MPSLLFQALDSFKGNSNSNWPLVSGNHPNSRNGPSTASVNGEGDRGRESRVNDWADSQDNHRSVPFDDRQNQGGSQGNFGTSGSRGDSGLEKLMNLTDSRSSHSSRARRSKQPSVLRQLAAHSITSFMDQRNKPKAYSPFAQQQSGRAVDYDESDYNIERGRTLDQQTDERGRQQERSDEFRNDEGNYNRQQDPCGSRYPERSGEGYSELEDTHCM